MERKCPQCGIIITDNSIKRCPRCFAVIDKLTGCEICKNCKIQDCLTGEKKKDQ